MLSSTDVLEHTAIYKQSWCRSSWDKIECQSVWELEVSCHLGFLPLFPQGRLSIIHRFSTEEGLHKRASLGSLIDYLGALPTTTFTDIQLGQGHDFKVEKKKRLSCAAAWMTAILVTCWRKYWWVSSFSGKRKSHKIYACACQCSHPYSSTRW